jgi:hypothetical protein
MLLDIEPVGEFGVVSMEMFRHDDDLVGEPWRGIWILCGVVDKWESASTKIPVEFGDRGDAMMGAGMVCLLRYFEVV